eukprot:658056-Pleurochrysis_carterae.AAC.1
MKSRRRTVRQQDSCWNAEPVRLEPQRLQAVPSKHKALPPGAGREAQALAKAVEAGTARDGWEKVSLGTAVDPTCQ